MRKKPFLLIFFMLFSLSFIFTDKTSACGSCPDCYIRSPWGDCVYVGCRPTCTGCQSCYPDCSGCYDDDLLCTGECDECSGGICVDNDSLCTGPCNESCIGGSCVPCGGNPNQYCCNNTWCCSTGELCCVTGCELPCEEDYSTETCSSAYNLPCVTCVGIFGDCAANYTIEYTNERVYFCAGGCPGDCADVSPKPICNRKYWCKPIDYNPLARCTDTDLYGNPVPLNCYYAGMSWGCTLCAPDYDNPAGEPYYADSQRCQ